MAGRIEADHARRMRQSVDAHERARGLLPESLGSDPSYPSPCTTRARGAFVWDVDGNRYLDLALGGGVILAGHAHPAVTAAIVDQAEHGSARWPPTTLEADLAEELRRRCPALELVAFTASGTEANLHASALARAVTGRGAVLRVDGTSAGVPSSPNRQAAEAGVVPFNDLRCLTEALEAAAGQFAAVVLEPVLTTAGIVPPDPGYLAGVRELADRNDALLVFDETRGGLRIGQGGAGARFGVRPDLLTLGPGIAAGLPIGVVGGRRDLLADGPAATGQASPLAVAGALACCTQVLTPETHAAMERRALRFATVLRELVRLYALPVQVSHVGAAGSVLFANRAPARSANESAGPDPTAWRRWWLAMLAQGVIPMPDAWNETWTVSAAHTDVDIDGALEAAETALASVYGA